MPIKIRQLKAELSKTGFINIRTRGSHTTWKHPLLPDTIVVISGNNGADAPLYQVRQAQQAMSKVNKLRGG